VEVIRVCLFSERVHKKAITKDLRVIRDVDVVKCELLVAEDVGKYWCRNCRSKVETTSAGPDNVQARATSMSRFSGTGVFPLSLFSLHFLTLQLM